MGVPVFERGAMMSNTTNSALSSLTIDSEVARRMSHAAMNTALGGRLSRPYLDLKSMVLMRLHLAEGQEYPFEFMEAHRSGDTVHVFIVMDGKPITLSDGYTLFPSDQLITKLNLLRK